MNRTLKSLILALALSLAGTAAMACGPDGCACCKDKDAKSEHGGKMHDMKGMKGMKGMSDDKPGAKPDAAAPSAPDPHSEHQH